MGFVIMTGAALVFWMGHTVGKKEGHRTAKLDFLRRAREKVNEQVELKAAMRAHKRGQLGAQRPPGIQ